MTDPRVVSRKLEALQWIGGVTLATSMMRCRSVRAHGRLMCRWSAPAS